MKKNIYVLPVLIYFTLWFLLSSCGRIEKTMDNFRYESIIGKIGDVHTTIGGKPFEYKHMKVEYSDSDASTLLLKDTMGNFVYIQGPAIIHFYDTDF